MQTAENKPAARGKTKGRKDSRELASSYATEKHYIVAARYDSSVGFTQSGFGYQSTAFLASSQRDSSSSKVNHNLAKKKQPPTRIPP